jgi:anti-anti-sigma regulatory factor
VAVHPRVSRPLPVELRLDDAAVRADRATRAALLARVTERVRATCALVVLADVGDLTASGAALDALARVQLTVRRAGADLVLEHASPDLLALLDLTGLAGALPLAASVEVLREAELGEQGGVHEVRDAGDPALAHLEQVDRPGLAATLDLAGLVLRERG